jgi:hypothetical protein
LAARFSASGIFGKRLNVIPGENETLPDGRVALLQWLGSLPLDSLSLAIDITEGVRGALRFSPDSGAREILEKLSEGDSSEENLPVSLFNFRGEGLEELIEFSIKPSGEGASLYEAEIETSDPLHDLVGDWKFFASPEAYGDEFVLLVGATSDDVEKSRAALNEAPELVWGDTDEWGRTPCWWGGRARTGLTACCWKR